MAELLIHLETAFPYQEFRTVDTVPYPFSANTWMDQLCSWQSFPTGRRDCQLTSISRKHFQWLISDRV